MGTVVTLLDQASRITCSQELIADTCCSCGVPFALPKTLRDACLKDHGKEFYCPNGHQMVFTGKTAEQKLGEQLEASRRRAEMAEQSSRRYREDAQVARRQASAYKGQLTRARKRAGAGVCPVTECHRTVKQLADHMKTKHPGYQA